MSPRPRSRARSSSSSGQRGRGRAGRSTASRSIATYGRRGRAVGAEGVASRPDTLSPMCGIVGYVGEQSALEVVIEGLRRLEYRGYDSAGVAVLADGELGRREAGRQAGQPGGVRSSEHPLATPSTGIGHTRWATHGAPTDRNAHPHARRTRPRRRHPQRHHRELRRAAGRARGRRGHELASDTDTEVVAHLLGRALRRRRERRPGRGDARACAAGWRARSRWSPCTPTRPDVVVGARRNSPAGGRRRRGRELPRPPTSPRSSRTPATRSSSARTRSSSCAATASTVTDFDGAPAEVQRVPRRLGRRRPPRRAATTTSCSRRSPSSRRRSPTPCSAGSTRRARWCSTRCGCPTQELRDVDKVVIVACGTAYHAGLVAKYAIEHWTRIPCEVELASEFRYRDPVLDRSHAGRRDLASPARPWTR